MYGIQSSLLNGACGPSLRRQINSDIYFASTKYKKEKYIRDQIAIYARKLAPEIVVLNSLEAYVTSQMIPIGKYWRQAHKSWRNT